MSVSTAVWLLLLAGFLFGVACWARIALATSAADRGTKIRHVFFVLFLVWMHDEPPLWLVRAIRICLTEGFDHLPEALYIDRMIVSGNAGLAIWLLVVMAGTGVLCLALGMARCRPWAGRYFVKLFPCIFLLNSLMMYVGMAARPGTRPVNTLHAVAFSQLGFLILPGWVYVWMYCFYRSDRSRLIFSERAGGTAGSPSSAGGR